MLLDIIVPHPKTNTANAQYNIKKKPNTTCSDLLSPSARYFEIYLTMVLPNPKLNKDKYDTVDEASENRPYSACPSIRSITGV